MLQKSSVLQHSCFFYRCRTFTQCNLWFCVNRLSRHLKSENQKSECPNFTFGNTNFLLGAFIFCSSNFPCGHLWFDAGRLLCEYSASVASRASSMMENRLANGLVIYLIVPKYKLYNYLIYKIPLNSSIR